MILSKENYWKLRGFETELGSTYTYLPDGTTQRFRQVDEELKAPQQAVVFVPPFERIIRCAPDSVKPFLGENPYHYHRKLVTYVQKIGDPTLKVRIVDLGGGELRVLWTNQEIAAAGDEVYLAFYSNRYTIDFTLPVSKHPHVGFFPFDTTRKHIGDHKYETTVHLGSEITKVVYR
jgi:hypothetical protein